MEQLTFDRPVTIAVGTSRKDTRWKNKTMTITDLYKHLEKPFVGTETLAEYVRLGKAQQDVLKDVGGFVAGTLIGGRRKTQNVTGRDVVTLDFDSIPAWGTDDIITRLTVMGNGYCVYSTRKHAANAPRLRILIPTDRTMTVDEYEPCARRLAARIGIAAADPTTFEAGRLMYWPSVCADSEFVFRYMDAPLANVDALLASYEDWHDIGSWPQVPGSFSYQKLATKQGDPEEKTGPVGAFCRAYTVYRAMEELLPGIYDPCAEDDRFTYLGGSTTGGAIVYDDGKFLFSHHATDPCSGKLVNAFDLVRLHKFGDQDDKVPADTVVNKLPSYKAMCEFAIGLKDVAVLLVQERREQAAKDFEGVLPETAPPADAGGDRGAATQAGEGAPISEPAEEDITWMRKLELELPSGKIKSTIDNVRIILENDPELKGKIAFNGFSSRMEILGVVPWDNPERVKDVAEKSHKRSRLSQEVGAKVGRAWQDEDSNGLYWYLEHFYNITGRGNIDAAVSVYASYHAFNNVVDFLEGLQWDGVPRLETMLVDYLGAKDTDYTRAVTRKIMVAAVARAMVPGCKFDNMLILCGKQGLGKSTIVDKLSRGYYNDNLRTFEGKDAAEQLQGAWLIEVAELDAFKRSEVGTIKQFISLRTDRYRAAYGRNVKELPRNCVFFGTCNQFDFLQDTTGNRRFWPVDVGVQAPTKSVFDDLEGEELEQIWAEAKVRWQIGEQLYLTGKVEEESRELQELHREASPLEGMITDFVERQVPADWGKWTIDRRRDFWAGGLADGIDSIKLVDRDRICALEIWCELLGKNKADIRRADAREINNTLMRLPGWVPKAKTMYFGPYGTYRGLERISGLNDE